MQKAIEHAVGLRRAVGLKSTAKILAKRLLRLSAPIAVVASGHRVVIRPMDSDLFVAAQIFGWREYDVGPHIQTALSQLARKWKEQGFVPIIVDGGANVGFSSLYFSDMFPDALVIAIEPDPVSFDCLISNCAGQERIIPMKVALWSHEQGVTLQQSNQSGSWAHRVCDAGQTPSRRLDRLLTDVPNGRPLVLKLDIEGAEREVCASAGEAIREIPCILIEPHDFLCPGAASLTSLFASLAGRTFDTLIKGENLLVIDSSLAAPPVP
jgi:FkbM family methyltransferase